MTVNVNSLSLVEGEQQKLACDIRNYYPADIHVQWLREPRGARRLPDTVPNVLTSSHRRSSNGTYSFSRFFLLTATLHEDGHTYTCRVEHSSLQAPIRRSVSVAVRGTELCAGAVWALIPWRAGGRMAHSPIPVLSDALSKTNKKAILFPALICPHPSPFDSSAEATSTTWLLLLLLGLTGCLVAALHHLHKGENSFRWGDGGVWVGGERAIPCRAILCQDAPEMQ